MANAGAPASAYVAISGSSTDSPTRGTIDCPTTPIAIVIATDMSVNPTTHDFLRCVASEIAPNKGIDSTINSEEMLLATAATVFDEPRSFTSQTPKKSVTMFIEKIVFEKS